MKSSDPHYEEMIGLVMMRAVITNPHMHLQGYGRQEIEPEANKQLDDEMLAETRAKIDAAQAAILLQED